MLIFRILLIFIINWKCKNHYNQTFRQFCGYMFLIIQVQKGIVADPALQAEWAKKRLVWVPHETEGFVSGSIKDDRGDDAVVELVDNGKVNQHGNIYF